jgi:Protein of unknown function DUF262
MKGYPTSYAGMFTEIDEAAPPVASIEIPLIQRDYAQGRVTPRVDEIRSTFLDALHQAITGGEPIGLDFVYGEINDGTFEPLDGQQRLTTLFLLHWYLAFRTEGLGDLPPWTRFSYATRPSARLFCERLVEHLPPADVTSSPSTWLVDQPWYLHVWRFDPTIQSMLVMLDAIATVFAGDDLEAAWARLTDELNPAVWFQLLPIDEMGPAADLYIKMNSRGKPLTEFEVFKAQLGKTIAHTERGIEFGQKVDGSWADLLWDYRGENGVVDDEFMRYLDFVLEVCEWRENVGATDRPTRPERRAQALFSEQNPRHREHLDFFFRALDVWVDGPDPRITFESIFATTPTAGRIRLFGTAEVNINLFQACCERYGETRGRVRMFSLTDTLLLYATLIYRIEGTEDPVRRLRQLRNVNEASQFEMRVQNMPTFINEVTEFMRTGSLEALATFNQNQVIDEQARRAFLTQHPELQPTIEQLEDHAILRGTLASFDLQPETIRTRAAAFEQAFAPEWWPILTGALLATGPYQRDYPKSDYHQFGSPTTESVWRTVLVDRGDPVALAPARTALSAFLDSVAASSDGVEAHMQTTMDEFLAERIAACELDWRYYLVRYPMMREGNSGIYYGANHALGYQMTMLRKSVQRSWYRDPYLYAIWRESGSPEEVTDPWFYGYSTDERWMRLERSGAALRSVPAGIALQAPTRQDRAAAFKAVCGEHSDVRMLDEGWLLEVAQTERDGALVDVEDRVQKAAAFLRELVAAGL